jgi:hypothetical protein
LDERKYDKKKARAESGRWTPPPGTVLAVVRLRFVEEYRGQRIVSNGKLYGVQGELITDCRYLNVLGARTAIDSEAGIERRKKYLEWRRHVTPHERARTEDWERFNEVKRLLKRKYKGRFASLTPTEAAAKNLLGGNTFATLKPT